MQQSLFGMKLKKISHEFIYGENRKKSTKNFIFSVAAIVCSIIVSLLITEIIYANEGSKFLKVIEQIFLAPFSSSNWKNTISSIAVFVVAGLSFIFANKIGIFNIGISGQMLFGAQIGTILTWFMPNVPNGIGQIIMIFICMFFASMISLIIILLKIHFNVNEVISSIVFNWIIYFCGAYLLSTIGNKISKIDSSGLNTQGLSPNFTLAISGNSNISGSWLVLTIIMFIVIIFSILLLNYSTFGKKCTCTGYSLFGSEYAGINIKKNQIIIMIISGALAGLLGAMIYAGKDNTMNVTITDKAIPQDGFNGISIGLIAMNNPYGVLPVSFLFGMIQGAKANISQVCGVDIAIADLMFGIIVYGSAIITIFYWFKPWIWIKRIFMGKTKVKRYDDFIKQNQSNIDDLNDKEFLLKNYYKLLKIYKKNAIEQTNLAKNKFFANEKEKIKKLDKTIDFLFNMYDQSYDTLNTKNKFLFFKEFYTVHHSRLAKDILINISIFKYKKSKKTLYLKRIYYEIKSRYLQNLINSTSQKLQELKIINKNNHFDKNQLNNNLYKLYLQYINQYKHNVILYRKGGKK